MTKIEDDGLRETLWAVYTNTDLTEGRGGQYVKYFCKLQATAIRLGKNGYVQGTDCPVKEVEVLNLDGHRVLPMHLIKIEPPNQEDEQRQARIDARQAAIARAKEAGLTDDDINLLGVRI